MLPIHFYIISSISENINNYVNNMDILYKNYNFDYINLIINQLLSNDIIGYDEIDDSYYINRYYHLLKFTFPFMASSVNSEI